MKNFHGLNKKCRKYNLISYTLLLWIQECKLQLLHFNAALCYYFYYISAKLEVSALVYVMFPAPWSLQVALAGVCTLDQQPKMWHVFVWKTHIMHSYFPSPISIAHKMLSPDKQAHHQNKLDQHVRAIGGTDSGKFKTISVNKHSAKGHTVSWPVQCGSVTCDSLTLLSAVHGC